MNQEIFQILEFNEIRKMLAKLAPSSLSKQKSINLCPSDDIKEVSEWLLQTEEANICLEKEITTPLGETHDIFKILKKAEKDIILLPKEFMELANSIETYNKMHHYFEGERHLLYPLLEELSQNITPDHRLIRDIRQVFDDKGEIRDQASIKLAKIRNDIEHGRAKIRKAFEKILTDKNQSSYFQDFIVTQRNHRYVVPVKEEYRYSFKGIVHDRSSTGQTLFMEPMISVQLNNDLAELISAERQEIHTILENLTQQIKKNKDILEKNCHIATEIEFIFARGFLSLSMHGTKAVCAKSGEMILKNARHPLIPENQVVPISLTLGKSFHILIITGSNAGGKTIAIKTAGLLALMNQSGLFIPADEGSILPVYKNIYSIIGDEQSIQLNLSTFSSYIKQLISFLPIAEKGDLVLLDELGSGTDPVEGAALAQAVTEYLDKRSVATIITSHFSEMKRMAYERETIENAFVEFDLETLSPTYRLIIGVSGNSNAFNICKRMGVPGEIITRAEMLQKTSPLYHMESVMENLNRQMQEVEQKKADIADTLREAEHFRDELKDEVTRFYEKKDGILEKARTEAENIKRDLRLRSEEIIKSLKKKEKDSGKDNIHAYINGVRASIDLLDIPEIKNKRKNINIKEINIGETVYIDTLDTDGEVMSISGRKVTINCGFSNVTVDAKHCFVSNINKSSVKKMKSKSENSYSLLRKETVSTTLNIIGKTVDEAIPEIDRFLNDCLMSGVSPVQIIHGKGTGKLRKGVQNYLKNISFISKFESAAPQNGGEGVTNVYF